MNDSSRPILLPKGAAGPFRFDSWLLRCVAWCAIAVWQTCVDWRTKRPLLVRVAAHGSVVILAIVVLILGRGGGGAQAAGDDAFQAGGVSLAGGAVDAVSNARGGVSPLVARLASFSAGSAAVVRLPLPHTSFPNRERLQVVTYVVQPGDTVFDIAARFGLSPETIVWSNREAINDAPWLIRPGLELFILPEDGVYHTVREGESVESIAAKYGVEAAALYNQWNNLRPGDQLMEGQLLVVPGGRGDDVSWTPPPLYPAPGPAGYSYGVCSGATVSGPGANGWFILPTGSPYVSGWYFHDPRNPTHIGLDYGCRSGDPIYAADSGVVTIAGWNGGYGIMVEINHGNGFTTRYAHLREGSLVVGCGHTVYQGDRIGACGSTGWSSGAHLHFEVRYGGVPQDPLAYQP